jgi:hypothetical protein
MARPPRFPAGHPLASEHMKRKYPSAPPPPDPEDQEPFTFSQFVGYVSAASMRFSKNGDLLMEVVVPVDRIEEALPLRIVARQNLPLDFYITVWEPYEQQVVADNERILRALNG